MIVRRTWIAWLILAGFLSTQPAVWVAAHHAALEDDACAAPPAPVVGAHHQAGPQLEEPNLPNPIEHCVFCHLYRTFSAAGHARVALVLAAPRLAARLPEQTTASVQWSGTDVDLRGPPSTHR